MAGARSVVRKTSPVTPANAAETQSKEEVDPSVLKARAILFASQQGEPRDLVSFSHLLKKVRI